MPLIRHHFKRIDTSRITYCRGQQTPFARKVIASISKEELTDNDTSENDGTEILGGMRVSVLLAVDLLEQKIHRATNL